MDLPRLDLDPGRAAVHRLADSIWWGPQDVRLEVATLFRRSRWPNWLVMAVAIAVAVIVGHGC